MTMTRAHGGNLRERVTIRAKTRTVDGVGRDTESWSTQVAANVPASVDPLMGQELMTAKQLQSEVTHKVRMRYRTGILPTMRIEYRSRNLQILEVLNVGERRRMIELRCKEMVT